MKNTTTTKKNTTTKTKKKKKKKKKVLSPGVGAVVDVLVIQNCGKSVKKNTNFSLKSP